MFREWWLAHKFEFVVGLPTMFIIMVLICIVMYIKSRKLK